MAIKWKKRNLKHIEPIKFTLDYVNSESILFYCYFCVQDMTYLSV